MFDPNIVFLNSTQNNVIVTGILKGIYLTYMTEHTVSVQQKNLESQVSLNSMLETDNNEVRFSKISIVDHE